MSVDQKIPKPPKFSLALLGPGIVLIAMGLGSGEYILWPYLISQYGFGVLWGALLGITFQYFVSNETGRYTLATGGSVYEGYFKLNKYLPFWFVASTYLSFAWPGIIGSGGLILSQVLSIQDHKYVTIIMLLLIGLLLTLGGKVYNILEKFQKFVIAISIPILVTIAILIIDTDTINLALQGLGGVGEGYIFLPSGISIISFLGAVVYSGAGGNLVASQSFYLQDEGSGAAAQSDSQVSFASDVKGHIKGKSFLTSSENIHNFKGWFRITAIEQFISFWFLGLFTIVLLALIAYELAYPFEGKEGLDFVFLQSDILKSKFSPIFGTFFLLIGSLFLFKTQLGIFETTSRTMTENIQLGAPNFTGNFRRSSIFYFFLWLQIMSAVIITYLNISQPITILLIGTFFSAVSMFMLSILSLWMNYSSLLPKEIRAGKIRSLILVGSVLFFGFFVSLTIYDILK